MEQELMRFVMLLVFGLLVWCISIKEIKNKDDKVGTTDLLHYRVEYMSEKINCLQKANKYKKTSNKRLGKQKQRFLKKRRF